MKRVLFAIFLISLTASCLVPPDAYAVQTKPNIIKSIKSTMTLEGHDIPANPATGLRGIGAVCVEMHLSTSKSSPWLVGNYRELDALPYEYKSTNYMSAPGGGTITQSEWLLTGQPKQFPGGALGYMNPNEEIWYMNMRWEYVDWYYANGSTHTRNIDWVNLAWHRQHRKILVTNMTTGLRAIAYIGDSGPGLNLGNPSGNRIAGLSPDLMYYLSNQQSTPKIPTTVFGVDNNTDYSFEWVKNQNLPLGPVAGVANIAKIPRIVTATKTILPAPAKPIARKAPKDLGNGFVRINFDKLAFVGDWTAKSRPYLNAGEVYAVSESADGWYKIYFADSKSYGWIATEFVTPGKKISK